MKGDLETLNEYLDIFGAISSWDPFLGILLVYIGSWDENKLEIKNHLAVTCSLLPLLVDQYRPQKVNKNHLWVKSLKIWVMTLQTGRVITIQHPSS